MWLGIFLLWLIRKSSASRNVRNLKMPKKRFVFLVLHWCSANFGTIKHPCHLKIYYYRNSNYSGRYMSLNKQIVVYLYPDLELIELVDTIIHEYVHHLQFQRKSTEKDYNKQLSSYWNNKYEVEARSLAKQHRKDCLKSIMNQI